MKKVKMFFAVAALVLVTAGVFAGKAKFATFALYASKNGTTFLPITTSASFSDLAETSSSANQAYIISSNSNGNYGLYYSNVANNSDYVETSGF